MTVALCSAASGPHLALMAQAEPTFRKYAAEHGWDCYIDLATEAGRPPSWHKVRMVRNLLERFGYDTVVWVDADAKVLNPARSVVEATDTAHPLWMAEHRVAGRDYLLPNCGVLVAHASGWLSDFLDEVWGMEQYVEHPWWEQAAILHLLGWQIERPGGLASPGPETEWTPIAGFFGTEWNSMPHDPHPDPVIRHWSGMPFGARLEGMRA